MSDKKLCDICERLVDHELFDYHRSTENHILYKIQERYPIWVNSKEKVVWFYRNFLLKDPS
ncbi:hypothetical protein MJH12_20350 [bacterium]|nr:hypothetical protein [bacterium]